MGRGAQQLAGRQLQSKDTKIGVKFDAAECRLSWSSMV